MDIFTVNAKSWRAWQNSISHVPYHIFLTDSSITENIAFGVPDAQVDQARVVDAARRAQIDGFIKTLPEGYQTTIGESGVRISGGQ